jgi:hypothetical protein
MLLINVNIVIFIFVKFVMKIVWVDIVIAKNEENIIEIKSSCKDKG